MSFLEIGSTCVWPMCGCRFTKDSLWFCGVLTEGVAGRVLFVFVQDINDGDCGSVRRCLWISCRHLNQSKMAANQILDDHCNFKLSRWCFWFTQRTAVVFYVMLAHRSTSMCCDQSGFCGMIGFWQCQHSLTMSHYPLRSSDLMQQFAWKRS